MTNLYETLGVEKTATADEIHSAFKKLAKQHHPDVTGGDAEEFNKIRHAHQTLMDEEDRKAYDEWGVEPGNPESEIRFQAYNNLKSLFLAVVRKLGSAQMERVDIIQEISEEIDRHIGKNRELMQQVERGLIETSKLRAITEKRMKKKKGGGNADAFLEALDEVIKTAPIQKRTAENSIKMLGHMKDFLGEYRYDFIRPDRKKTESDVIDATMVRLFHFSSTNSTSSW